MFSYDGSLMRTLNKITDIVILNVLTFLFCLPIITAGAAITAAHYTALKMRRDTGNYVLRNFFKSFKENFLQSTLIWILWMIFMGMSAFAMLVYGNDTMQSIMKGIILAAVLMALMASVWLFPVQSKFINPIRRTIKNSFFISIKFFWRTLLMMIVVVGWIVLCYLILAAFGFGILWFYFFFALSIPIYICAMIYDKPFEKLEEQVMASMGAEEETNEDDIIMHDESRYALPDAEEK